LKRPLKPEELRVWGVVTGTVHPLPGRVVLAPPPTAEAAATGPAARVPPTSAAKPQPAPRARMLGTTAFVRRYGVITFTSYATRSRRSEVSSIDK